MLVDANLLLYAIDERNPHHRKSLDWLTSALNGGQRVGLPWPSLAAFLRITTNTVSVGVINDMALGCTGRRYLFRCIFRDRHLLPR